MSKKEKKGESGPAATTSTLLSASTASFDPALSALFSSSSGPVKFPGKQATKPTSARKQQPAASDLPTPDTTSSEGDEKPDEDSSASSESENEAEQEPPRKRRRLQGDELEDVYFRKLADAEERELEKRQEQQLVHEDDDEVSDSPSNDLEDISDDEDAVAEAVPVHESLSGAKDEDLADKTSRTIFLSNVSTVAIKDKTAKKTLLAHLESAFPKDSVAKIESIRFRSTPYESGKGPKRAAYATKALMEETSASTHAYVVLSSDAVAKRVTAKLNGTVVLDRHLHIDQLGSPNQTDHRRCIFVGNLPFVDQETMETNDEENPRKRPKAKLRADPEEGLWRTFSKVGKVENVRMVRDKATRIGKGFAYVQFSDENAVEAALLMNEKKFPPLLPRKLRIMRAKKPSTKPKQLQSRSKQDDRKGRGKGVQKSRERGNSKSQSPGRDQKIVFEGHRASKSSAKDRAVKTKSKKKPTTRSAKRGSAFKSGGGKKKRDMK